MTSYTHRIDTCNERGERIENINYRHEIANQVQVAGVLEIPITSQHHITQWNFQLRQQNKYTSKTIKIKKGKRRNLARQGKSTISQRL